MKELLGSFKKSLQRLEEALAGEKTALNRDAAIQRFEFSLELAWKCIQRFLREQRIACRSPKECLQEAFKFGLVDDDPRWIKAFDDRNLTVHTYNEKLAEEVYERLTQYIDILKLLEERLDKQNVK